MKPAEIKAKIEAYEHALGIVVQSDDPSAMGWEVISTIKRRLVLELDMLKAMKPAKEREKVDG